MEKFINLVLNQAQMLGAEYADIRIQETKEENYYLKNMSFKNNSKDSILGYGIRFFKNGAWGFAHSGIFTEDAFIKCVKEAAEICKYSAQIKTKENLVLANERGYIDEHKTNVKLNPFDMPIREKLDFMREINRILLNYKEIKMAEFNLEIRNDDKTFASTLGSRIKMNTTFIRPTFTAYAMNDEDSQSRMFDVGGHAAGWEFIQEQNLFEQAHSIANEAIMKVNAAELPSEPKRKDLILDPYHLSLTMHESVGHPTELDRVLGWEADMAGLSFATPEKLKNYQYGSPIVNFLGDNTLSDGLATAGYDDDGVPGQKWYIIKNGILNEYGSTRDTIPFINGTMSRGCSRATYYYDFPINRIPNLYLEAGEKKLSPQELIQDTQDGIYIENHGSFSIDQHRLNFQFGGDLFWEIKNGKKTRMLKKIIYKSNNPEFWNSCDAICDKRFWKSLGITNCGKGQPEQAARMTHGASTARFRNIRVGGSL